MHFRKLQLESNPSDFFISGKPKIAFRIYLVTVDNTSPFTNAINQGVSDMSKLTGFHYIWEAPTQIDVESQIQILQNAIQNGADAIMLEVIDPVLECGIVEDAKSLGIKVIYVNTPANEKGIITLATNNYNAGICAGESMLEELDARGINNGMVGIISINKITPTCAEREKGFHSVMHKDGRFQVLPSNYTEDNIVLANWSAQSLIALYPNLVGILGISAATTLGVGRAIQLSGKSMVGIGFETNKAITSLINLGYLQAVMLQNPYSMGYLGMAETIAALYHLNTGPEILNTGTNVTTKY